MTLPPSKTGLKSTKTKSVKNKRKFRTVSLADSLKSLVGREFKRRGFAVTEVVSRWSDIVGAEMYSYTRPEKLTFQPGRGDNGTLILKVAPGFAPTVTHMSPFIIEKVNGYFGHACVGRLKVIQGPLPPAKPAPKPDRDPESAPLHVKQAVDAQVAPVADPELKATLARLGRLVKRP